MRKVLPASLVFLAIASIAPLSAQTLYVPGGAVGSISGSNVGIGTTTPSAKLHVAGGGAILATNGFSSQTRTITILNDGLAQVNFGSYPGEWSPALQIQNNDNSRWIWLSPLGSGSGGNARLVTAGGSNFDIWPGNIHAATFTTNGNVGIGTTSPGQKLEVVNPGSFAAVGVGDGANFSYFGFAESATHYNSNSLAGDAIVRGKNGVAIAGGNGGSGYAGMRIDNAGNVGIGTATPGTKLDVYSTVNPNGIENVLTLTGGNSAEAGPAIVFKPYYSGSYPAWKVGSISVGYAGHLGYDGAMHFSLNSTAGTPTDLTERMTIVGSTGNVGIGTTSPSQKLAVNGTIRAKEVIVDTGWSDYVFAKSYRLAPLSEVEQCIEKDGHLPGIPSAQEVAEHGVTLGEMQSKLLAKIEELTLHQIQQEKEISALKAEVIQLRKNSAP